MARCLFLLALVASLALTATAHGSRRLLQQQPTPPPNGLVQWGNVGTPLQFFNNNQEGTYRLVAANGTQSGQDGTYHVLFNAPNGRQILMQDVPVQIVNGVPQVSKKCPTAPNCLSIIFQTPATMGGCPPACGLVGTFKTQDGTPSTIILTPTADNRRKLQEGIIASAPAPAPVGIIATPLEKGKWGSVGTVQWFNNTPAGTYQLAAADGTEAGKDGAYQIILSNSNGLQFLLQDVPVQFVNGAPQVGHCPGWPYCDLNIIIEKPAPSSVGFPCLPPQCGVAGMYKTQDGTPSTIILTPTN